MPAKVKREFWLSATIQDCKVVTAQETASAKCFLKIHWQDKAFPDKIRSEKLLLDAGSRKDMKLEKTALELENGDLVYGMLDAAPDSFPINIDSIFLNQISAERIGGLCWTKYEKQASEGRLEAGLVSVSGCAVETITPARFSRTYALYVICLLTPRTQVQIVMNVTVHAPMGLRRYPYDRHIVPFCLGTRATKDTDGTLHKWKLSKEWPKWAPAKYPEDKAILSETQATEDLEYEHKQCFVYLETKKPILCVVIERQPTSTMTRVALPVFIVVSIALSVSGIKDTSFQDEYSAALTSLLTLTAFSYSVQSSLPKLPYLTWADKYFLVLRQQY